MPAQIFLKFTSEQERSRWFTYLNYLKERLQYKYFVEKFDGIADIPISQETKVKKLHFSYQYP